ncbi:12266_t:CDS:2 [Ambispora gerdemannii]|uniref:12266_t:CDS:1 n=1 Tax=Ambispora gerdemannii TaxID=144530 RepID=A0A9N9AYY2_9GLOM|nr:12266_t:CDS:2 [Ambispora gerdemannii]
MESENKERSSENKERSSENKEQSSENNKWSFKLVDSKLRLLINVVIQSGRKLVYAKKGESLAQAVFSLACGGEIVAHIAGLQKKPELLVQAPNNNAVTLGIGELNKIIKSLAQNVGEMSQHLFDKFKVLLRMEAGCQIQLPNGQVVRIFGSIRGPETWQQSVVRQINSIVQYIKSDLGIKAPQILVIVLSLLLVSWSVVDLCNVYKECMEDLPKPDKQEYLKLIKNVVATLTKICDKLENKRIGQYKELLDTLVVETTKLINKIDKSKEEIKERIKILKEKESDREIAQYLFASASIVIGSFTSWNWSNWNTASRTAGIVGSGAAAGGAIAMMTSVMMLKKAQAKQEELLENMMRLNKKLSDIKESGSVLEYDLLSHEVICVQFQEYRKTLLDYQAQFRNSLANGNQC